ncbi:cyclic AMP-dependent transcription factor ATF-2-like isoform X2 [Ornithodoros turicata]|uniref:cyclic AMP-dependent transcription factor ATF-2-like isoform X2 n=1 Tax=Ornithodoros turicata TaxID=34597 RepID=UPI0031387F34
MGETEKPFACDISGCGVRFVSADRLASHRKKHHMALSLECGNDGGERSIVEQTPTPTRFLRGLDNELFQDLRTGFTPETVQSLQSVNPFEEDFRRGVQAASQGTLLIHESGHEANDSLNTPCIPPVTADPLRAPALPILHSSSSATEKNIDSVLPAATSPDTGDETSPFVPSSKEHDEVPHRQTRKDSTSRSRPENLRLRLGSERSDTATESSSPEPSKDLSAGGSKHRMPVITSLRIIQNQTMGPVATSILKDVTPDIVTTVQPVSSLPKTSIIAAPAAASVIQIPANVQLVIMSNPAATSAATTTVASPLHIPQQDARTKLKEALSSRSQYSSLRPAFVATPSENCTLAIPSPLRRGDGSRTMTTLMMKGRRRPEKSIGNAHRSGLHLCVFGSSSSDASLGEAALWGNAMSAGVVKLKNFICATKTKCFD